MNNPTVSAATSALLFGTLRLESYIAYLFVLKRKETKYT
jgi:hypothetical protein